MTTDNTNPRAGLDLDAIEARIGTANRICAWQSGDGCYAVATQRCDGGDCGLVLCDAHAKEHEYDSLHDAYPLPVSAVPEARALLAEVRRLLTLRDDLADAFDGLVMKVWRATGETHEPPADVAALTDRVDALRCEAESLTRRLAGRDETNANLLGRLIAAENAVAAARREGAEAMREACAAEADHFAGESVAAYIRALPLPEGEP